jgi:hypothetical protein
MTSSTTYDILIGCLVQQRGGFKMSLASVARGIAIDARSL